ncbi:hypothetical protein HZS_8041 [Henneguya salminicola]|nr:hypothetical protein HZS_8041 [Henneguya salminicola]
MLQNRTSKLYPIPIIFINLNSDVRMNRWAICHVLTCSRFSQRIVICVFPALEISKSFEANLSTFLIFNFVV